MDNIQEVVERMSVKYDTQGIMLKVVEETTELNEVLIKCLTKTLDLQPPIEKIIEETGDVLVRLMIMIEKLGIQKEVDTRISEKSEQILKFLNR